MRRHRLPFLCLALVAACSQPPSPPGEQGATPGSPGSLAVASAQPVLTAVATAPGGTCETPDYSVPPEKFSDAARNFDEARKALMTAYYDGSFTEEDLYRAAVAGMLERLDPKMHKWNRLLAPSEIAQLRSDLQGEIVGVGVSIELDPTTGYIDVKKVYPGSPAARAGIAPPDKIVTVNGKLYRGLTAHDAAADIRGKAGETVTLSILRGDKLVSVPLVRQKVAFDEVEHLMLNASVGYLQIPGFNAKTPQQVHDALTDLGSRGAHALVLDLRHSPGGSFDDAVAAVGELVPAGSTVVSLNKRGKLEPVVPTTTPVLSPEAIAVLVDHETASSAELVTAALQELEHATVIGSHTKGKWTVQRIDDLPNGYAIKYTVAVFASPGGKSYEGTGMTPDIEVDQSDDATMQAQMDTDVPRRLSEDSQLRTAMAVLARR